MTQILMAAVLFLGTHLGISSTGLRAALTDKLGERGYLGLYSVLALITLSYLIWIYGELPRFEYVWQPDPNAYLVPKLLMPLAAILLVGGFMVKNPTNVGAESLLQNASADADLAHGVTRITRHPFQWAVMLWAIGHLVANGDTVSIVFFATFGILSGLGSVLLDAKKARTLGSDWIVYRNQTSNLPFAAIVAGRNRLVAKELLLPVLVGLAVYGLMFWGHQWLSGVRII